MSVLPVERSLGPALDEAPRPASDRARELRARNALLTGSLAAQRELAAAGLAEGGVPAVLAHLERRIGRPVELVTGERAPSEGAHAPILGGGEQLGWLTVAGAPLVPLQAHALQHGASAIALELLRERTAHETLRRLRGELLEQLVATRGPVEPLLAERASRLGHDLTAPVRLLVIAATAASGAAEPAGLHHAVQELLGGEAAERDAPPPLIADRDGRVLAAVPVRPRDAHAPARLQTRLRERGWQVAVGVSRPGIDAAAAHAEARACLRLALRGRRPAVVDAQRLGPLRFLLDAPDCAVVAQLVRERLGPLAAADRRSRAAFLMTTRAYVEADGHQQTVATRCAIHVNTLKYRLARIEELLGYPLRDPGRRFELRLALALLDLLDELGLDPLERSGVGS